MTETYRGTPGTNTLVLGAAGTGKTHVTMTLADNGITPCYLFTEPGMEVVAKLLYPKENHRAHSMYLPPATPDFSSMIESAKKINTMSFEMLTKMSDMGGKATNYNQFITLLTGLNNYTCDVCGEVLGPVDAWGTDRALIADSMSGLNIMAMDLVVGSKPVKAPGEWQVAMDNLSRLIQKLCLDTTCHFVLTAHLEPERDEVTGSIKNMASTLGRKLAPVIPRFFSDVVQCKRTENKFVWSTNEASTDLKFRNLPMSSNITPDFGIIINQWKKNGGEIWSPTPTLQKAQTA